MAAKTNQTRRTVLSNIGFPEGLRWHGDQLWYSDFLSRTVNTLGAHASEQRAYVPAQPSGLGFQPNGTPWVVSTYDRKILALDGRPRIVADIGHLSRGPLNDMYVDPVTGAAYVSPFGWENAYTALEDMQAAPLIMVRPNADAEIVAEDLLIPNGIARFDSSTLLVAETHGNRITAFDIGIDGRLANRRIFAELGGRAPDGICVDIEGCVWAGCPFTSEFVRVREGGDILEVISVPGEWAICPVLGGQDRSTLYLGTAVTDLDDFYEGRARGSISTVRVDVPGHDDASIARKDGIGAE